MNALERAKLLKELLANKTQLAGAAGLAKAKAVAAILRLREQLGMAVKKAKTVVDLIRENPIDKNVTLPTADYTKTIRKWLPKSFDVSLDAMEMNNAKGSALALQEVLEKFPKLAEQPNIFRAFGLGESIEKLQQAKKRKLKKKIEERIQASTDLQAQYSKEFDERFSKNIAYYSAEWPNLCHFARKYTIARDYLGLENRQIDNLLKNTLLTADEFFALCKKVYIHDNVALHVTPSVEEENPDLTNVIQISREMRKHMAAYSGTWAFAQYGSGVFASSCFRRNMTERVLKNVEAAYHPAGTCENSAHGGAQHVIMHEMGHVLDYLLSIKYQSEITDLWGAMKGEKMKDALSEYANKNISEMIAEGFCEYMLSKNPRPVAQQIGKVIEQTYKNRFGEAA